MRGRGHLPPAGLCQVLCRWPAPPLVPPGPWQVGPVTRLPGKTWLGAAPSARVSSSQHRARLRPLRFSDLEGDGVGDGELPPWVCKHRDQLSWSHGIPRSLCAADGAPAPPVRAPSFGHGPLRASVFLNARRGHLLTAEFSAHFYQQNPWPATSGKRKLHGSQISETCSFSLTARNVLDEEAREFVASAPGMDCACLIGTVYPTEPCGCPSVTTPASVWMPRSRWFTGVTAPR